MTRGTRLVVVELVPSGDGYDPVPRRQGVVLGHPVGDLERVVVLWLSGNRTGQRQLMRVDEVQRWAWR